MIRYPHREFVAILVLALAALLGLSSPGCKIEEAKPPVATVTVTPPPYGQRLERLSDWHLFADLTKLDPAEGVIPYDVNAPLFTDYTKKFRWIFVPRGKKAIYSADGVYDLPVGSILVKLFTYPADERDPQSPLRRLETRVFFHEPDGWLGQTYVWDDDGKDATRMSAGTTIAADFIDSNGAGRHDDYQVPNAEACKNCHMTGNSDTTGMNAQGVVTPIGVRTLELERGRDYGELGVENQIDHMARAGIFAGPPPPSAQRQALVDPFDTKHDLTTRVRAYWDSNCAHCHHTGGLANPYGLHLDFASTDPAHNPAANWGVCKVPAAAPGGCGDLENRIDIVPGDPDRSFMVCRMAAALDGPDAKVHMPPIGVRMVHDEAVELVREWIGSLAGNACE